MRSERERDEMIMHLHDKGYTVQKIANLIDLAYHNVARVVTKEITFRAKQKLESDNTFTVAYSVPEKDTLVKSFVLITNNQEVINAYAKMINP